MKFSSRSLLRLCFSISGQPRPCGGVRAGGGAAAGRGRGARPRGQPAATRAHTRVGRGALCLPRAARLARVYTVHVFESKHLPRDSPSATEDLTISGAKFQNCQYDTGVRTGVLVLP